MKEGCSYGKVTRNMVENLCKDLIDLRTELRGEFIELKKTNQMLYNHLSDRLPKWAVALGGIGSIVFGVLIGLIINSMGG